MKWIVVILSLLVSGMAAASIPDHTPRQKVSDWMYYQGSCGSGGWGILGVTLAAAGDAKAFKQPGVSAASANNNLFRFGEQIRVECTEDSLICETMTVTATVTSAGTCAENCAYSTFDSANSRAGVLNCHFVAADAPESFFKISQEGWLPWDPTPANMNVTARRGSCTALGTATTLAAIGGGCNCTAGGASCVSDTECDGTGGGTCSMAVRPKGVYLHAIPLVNGGICRVSVCSQ